MKFSCAIAVLSLASITLAVPTAKPHTGHAAAGTHNKSAARTQLDALVASINTTLSSGNAALDTARQEVVIGIFDASAALARVQTLADKTGNANVSTIAKAAAQNVQLADGAAQNIEKAVETKSAVSQADQLNVAKGLFLANIQAKTLAGAIVTADAQLSTQIARVTGALQEAITGGEGVLAAQGVDIATLEQAVLGTTVAAPAGAATPAAAPRANRRVRRYQAQLPGRGMRRLYGTIRDEAA